MGWAAMMVGSVAYSLKSKQHLIFSQRLIHA
eukprot:COSAG01_NODE_12281_length_1766_cov_10.127175_2_plen_30_part_01